jgi:HNH endonuclease
MADRYRAGKRLWSAKDDARLRRLYPDTPTFKLAKDLRRSLTSVYARAAKLGIEKSAAYLAGPNACRLRRGDHVGAAFRFTPGHVPHNKGLRRPGWAAGRMRETQYKRGQRNGLAARHWMPVGSTRLIEGYVYRKVSDVPNVPYTVNWKPDHVLVWTRAHGPVPVGHAIGFRNGDKADVRLDNLVCLSRRELMLRNSVHNLPAPLPQVVQLLGALTRQIRRKTRGSQEQDRRSA